MGELAAQVPPPFTGEVLSEMKMSEAEGAEAAPALSIAARPPPP